MSTYQPTLAINTINLPRFSLAALVQRLFLRLLRRRTRKVLNTLTAAQLKDIGAYRDQRHLASTLSRQLW